MKRGLLILALVAGTICGQGGAYLTGVKSDLKINKQKGFEKLVDFLTSTDSKYDSFKTNPEAWKLLGDLELEINENVDKAMEAYQKYESLDADKEFKEDIDTKRNEIAVKLYNKGQKQTAAAEQATGDEKIKILNDAADLYAKAIKLDDTIFQFHIFLARTLNELNKDGYMPAYEKAIEIDKDKTASMKEYGYVLYNHQKYSEAGKFLGMVWEKDKSDSQVLKFQALSYVYAKESEKAESALVEAIKVNPEDVDLVGTLAQVYFTKGSDPDEKPEVQKENWVKVINLLEPVIDKNQEIPAYNYEYLGTCYVNIYNSLSQAKKNDEAKKYLEKCIVYMTKGLAVEKNKENANLWYYLYNGHLYLNHKKEADTAKANYEKFSKQ